jgi:hypothetical protein
VPRGDRMVRVAVVMKDCESRKIDLKKRRDCCQFENEKFFT